MLLEDSEGASVQTDVLVLGDDREATDLVHALADTVPGMRGVYAGRKRNAHQVEALTANLISMNRRYKAHTGVRHGYLGDTPRQAHGTVVRMLAGNPKMLEEQQVFDVTTLLQPRQAVEVQVVHATDE